jgi:hypothetical protein
MSTIEDIRKMAEDDLEIFIRLVAPERVLGHCHKEVIRWWTRQDAKNHQLLLFPRDHMKSALVAYRVAWALAKDPTLRILYISATSNLAEKQLSFIKNILTSDTFRRYWPEHIHPEEGKRSKWTSTEIALDHPLRKEENIRDPSLWAAGLTTSITGMHCDIAVLDDVVVYENAYTKEGRDKVKTQYSLLASIEGAESKEWVVGTRYHPLDLYGEMLQMTESIYDEVGNEIDEEPIYEVMERAVEDRGDGTGEFLWPRQQRNDGRWFGFDRQILARKRGKYPDRMQYKAQYYNDPNDPDSRPIDYDSFRYYEKNHITRSGGNWYYKQQKLNVIAAIDFAFSLRKTADSTCIVVIGVDSENNIFVLDIDRFKTNKISEYFDRILTAHNKWGFRKLVAEVNVGQEAVVKALKEDYFSKWGLVIRVEEVRPTRSDGSKEERIAATLLPRYENGQVYHYRGGNCQVLEDELVSVNPPHDDVKDTLHLAVMKAVRPAAVMQNIKRAAEAVFHPKFGGRM